MRQTLQLARRGMGAVSPNPMVGALIVRDGHILSRGYHQKFGGPHAEIVALHPLSPEKTKNSTIYINLEPCAHTGKTPPCTEAIIRAGISHAVIGIQDPNPLVRGKGIRALQAAGIQVTTDICKEACYELNEPFFTWIEKKRPFITLKLAQTLDGKIATRGGHSKWITCEQSLKKVHRLRHEHDGILVGIGTVLQDNPSLDVRLIHGKNGKRIILDSKLRIPEDARLLAHPDPENTILVCTSEASRLRSRQLQNRGITVWRVRKDGTGRIDLKTAITKAAEQGIISILVEGGSRIFTAFLEKKLADRLIVFIAPVLFGSGIEGIGDIGVDLPGNARVFSKTKWKRTGQDMLFEGKF